MVPFDIPIADDNILEKNEDFNIIIVAGSLPADVTRGNPGAATITIVDNDGKTYYIVSSSIGNIILRGLLPSYLYYSIVDTLYNCVKYTNNNSITVKVQQKQIGIYNTS